MKFSCVAALAVVAHPAAGFAPTANQRQSASTNVAFVKPSGPSTYGRGVMTMELQAFLGAGIGSLGLTLSGATSTVIVSSPSITMSDASSTRAPSAVSDVESLIKKELLLEKEVKADEKEAKVDAKVRFGIRVVSFCE